MNHTSALSHILSIIQNVAPPVVPVPPVDNGDGSGASGVGTSSVASEEVIAAEGVGISN